MSYSGLGAAITTPQVDVPALTLQQALLRAGFTEVGVADGVFGTKSESGLHHALVFLMQPDTFLVAPGRASVKIDPVSYNAIKAMPASSAPVTPTTTTTSHPSASSSSSSSSTTTQTTPPPVDTGAGMDWTPWLIGGGLALAAGGAYLMFSGPKGKPTHSVKGHGVRRNTRRRSTKRRKTRRTRRVRASSKRRRARGTTRRGTRRRVRRNGGVYRVVGPRGTVGAGRMSHADAIEALRRLGGARRGYRIVGGGIRANGGSAREVELDGYAYEYTGTRGHVFDSDDDDWETVMVTHLPGSVVGSRNIDGSRMAIVKAEDGRTYAILWHMMKNRRRA